ncbi:MAG: cobalamin B12-binding domain-containing protein [Deltaproteobacteria bacterium]|nr:cobalamin B12-binding domain-containing protein [Deltaproteobacteria bacterium]
MRVLMVRPPKYLWPYMNEGDNYLLSQAMVYVGAAARAAGHEVTLIDCGPAKMGWKSLERTIREMRPHVVMAGDSETLYEHETGRVFTLAKSVDPSIITVSGGTHFAQNAMSCMSRYPIDAIVRGEGEQTLTELLNAIDGGKTKPHEWADIPGLAARAEGDGVLFTGHRDLIRDLDTLPFPAYDLLPMHLFGASRYLFSPGGVTIHHSRGCTDNCNFCACWLQMSKRKGDPAEEFDEVYLPRWRTRTVDPVIDEMIHLKERYGKNCFVFGDDTWNVRPDWNDEFAEKVLALDHSFYWFGFMRADYLIRDEKLGIFEKLIRSGLSHICIGVERAEDEDLENMNKHNYSAEKTAWLIPYLKQKYPSLFIQSTFIVGAREDTPEKLDRMVEYVKKLDPDFPAFHPLTPVPGTKQYKDAVQNGWLEETDYSRYDWITPVMGTATMSREEVEYKVWEMNKKVLSLWNIAKGMCSPHTYKRRMYIWWALVTFYVSVDFVLDRVMPSRSVRRKAALSDYVGLLKPDWYEA